MKKSGLQKKKKTMVILHKNPSYFSGIHIFRWKLIQDFSTEMWMGKRDKMDLYTELFTLSTILAVNNLVYIGFLKERVFCEL